ncbi:hypothetical protein GGH98_001304 [Coemansia sp. RSA 454]|nr:hypothetical protein LPJ67_000321 [Coemansia sp. RSA 1938]KAJ2256762.1 hypothetical protein GGH98_001304 [Coemansia sp. RSA 454]
MARKRTRSEFEEDALHQFDWSAGEDMSYWSLTSLTSGSADTSMTSMPTPSPEMTPNLLNASYSSNDETLTTTERKQSFDEGGYVFKKKLVKTSTEGSSQTVPADSDDNIANGDQRTPEKLADSYRPSGSPTRVSGTKVVADINFANIDGSGVCKVDKSLVCKGFWDAVNKAGRICLPRRSGKTYNLTQLLLFFSQSPEYSKLKEIPDSIIDRDQLGSSDVAQLDMATKCRLKRECLFEGSLLQTMHPEFFKEHFMRYPVLHISLSECKGESLGNFIINLCGAVASLSEQWLKTYYSNNCQSTNVDINYADRLKRFCDKYESISYESANDGVKYSNFVLRMFKTLSDFVSDVYGRYILLIDEYDIPFITGLLFGVFEIPLTEMGSGANNIKDIRMVPTEENDIRGSILSAAHPHSGSGMDALTDSFWFNTNEVELMLDNSTRWCAKIAQHKPLIMQTIRDWYNGYFIGRFRGKYNPWSVSSFIESLCLLLNQSDADPCVEEIVKSAARPYWVTTGTTGLIEAQIDKHGPQFIRLAKRLLRNYEVAKLTKNSSQHLRESSHVPLISTRLNLISMEQFSEPGLLTLCLFAGYLTRRHSTSVCIPNHEVYQVWLALFARAVMGTEMADNSTNYERGALLSELWQGKTDILCSLAISSHGVLSNHNKFLEKDYANHFANTILAVSRFGMLSHPQQQLVRLSHVVPIRENHSGLGKCDYIMLLYSTDNQPNQLGVVIEFKLITKDKRRDCKYHMERAQEAIKQIADRDYNTCLIGCLERIDIGVAIGNNVAYAIPKLYRRKTVDKPWGEVKSLVKRRR